MPALLALCNGSTQLKYDTSANVNCRLVSSANQQSHYDKQNSGSVRYEEKTF